MKLHDVFDSVADAFEIAGVAAMVIGFLIAFALAGRRLVLGEEGSFSLLRTSIGSAILLGLEIMVAADLIRTITSEPSIENVTVLGIIVILRTILSMSIQIEIEGTLPWRRALTESGGTQLANTVKDETARHRARKTEPRVEHVEVEVEPVVAAAPKKAPAKKAAPRKGKTAVKRPPQRDTRA